MRLQRSSRSWSIECRISAASFTFAKRFAATAASYVIQAVRDHVRLNRKKMKRLFTESPFRFRCLRADEVIE